MNTVIAWVKSFLFSLYSWWVAWNTPKPQPQDPLEVQVATLITSRTQSPGILYWPRTPLPTQDPTKPPFLVSSIVPALTPPEVTQVTDLLLQAATLTKLELAFLLACMYQESHWAPAINHNLFSTNGVIAFDTTDWGQGQFSGTEVRSWKDMQGLTEDQMSAKLLDATYSVPLFAQVYAQKFALAVTLVTPEVVAAIQKLPSWCFAQTAQLLDIQQWYATVAYNAGNTGVQEVIAQGGYKTHKNLDGTTTLVAEHHGHNVQTWLAQFRAYLGTA